MYVTMNNFGLLDMEVVEGGSNLYTLQERYSGNLKSIKTPTHDTNENGRPLVPVHTLQEM